MTRDGFELTAYRPDDASWPAICHMLNEFLLGAQAENQRLRAEIAQRERALAIYRALLADFEAAP